MEHTGISYLYSKNKKQTEPHHSPFIPKEKITKMITYVLRELWSRTQVNSLDTIIQLYTLPVPIYLCRRSLVGDETECERRARDVYFLAFLCPLDCPDAFSRLDVCHRSVGGALAGTVECVRESLREGCSSFLYGSCCWFPWLSVSSKRFGCSSFGCSDERIRVPWVHWELSLKRGMEAVSASPLLVESGSVDVCTSTSTTCFPANARLSASSAISCKNVKRQECWF